MATKTEELIQALTIDVNTLKERVEALRGETAPLHEVTKQIAVIQHQLSELTKTRELWGPRGWMMLTVLLSAFFSFLAVVFGAFLTHYLNTNR